MKKSLFFYAAAAALMLTACSSEDDILQTGQTKQVAPQEVGFDVYTPAATNVTRAGQAGTMTTGRLQRLPENDGGFGVYAYLVEDNITGAGDKDTEALDYVTWQNRAIPSKAPNFMVNQLVKWNNTNLGWEYAPLKYWPNETDNDSQTSPAEMIGSASTSHLDRLTFFAYAPYVAEGVNEDGITLLTNKKGVLATDPTSTTTGTVVEASVGYQTALDAPSSSVDLLWGVVPAGGLTYTAVNGYTVSRAEGTPLMDMTKPDVNTSMKFLFQHALARIGINVVAAIDQVGAGGTLDSKTKITIDEVTLTGPFGATGILNLDNPTQSVANWTTIDDIVLDNTTTVLKTGGNTLELSAGAKTIAPDLCYTGPHTFGSYAEQTVSGVTTSKKDLIASRYYTLDEIPAYSPAKQYYSDDKGKPAVATYTVGGGDNIYSYDSGTGIYTKVTGTINAPAYPKTTSGYYSVEGDGTFNANHVVKFTATEASTYNEEHNLTLAGMGGTKSAGDTFTADEASAYNSAHKLSEGMGGYKTSGGYLNYAEADALNHYYPSYNLPTDGTQYVYSSVATNYNKMCNLSDGLGGFKKTGDTYTAEEATEYNTTHNFTSPGMNGYASENDVVTPIQTAYTEDQLPTSAKLYTRTGSEGAYVYTYKGVKTDKIWSDVSTENYYTLKNQTEIEAANINFKYTSPIYDKERNYFMVIPTNNVKTLNTGLAADKDKEEALRTIRVKIVYYVTTEDDKIDGGRTQIENVIEKDVLFPSLANGKSYMLNLVLGLTSVKMDAEVDDWKVINVQADLPQNVGE